MGKENKTQATDLSVDEVLSAIEDTGRRDDCRDLADLMGRSVGEPPRLWGSSIIGFGSYHYRYDSGREGDSCLVGFASRKTDIALYLPAETPGRDELLARLGPHREGKGCLYLKSLRGVDLGVLAELVANGARHRRETHRA